MDKESKILELKLKIIELTLEKEKDIHKTAISLFAATITFMYTSGFVIRYFDEQFKDFVKNVIASSSVAFQIIMLLVLLIGIPVLIAYLTPRFLDMIFFDSKEKMYEDSISRIKKLISEIDSKK